MGIGANVFLIAIGAVLAFAVNATVAGVDILVVGWLLMGIGVLGIFLILVNSTPRDRQTLTEARTTTSGVQHAAGPVGGGNVVIRHAVEDMG